MLSHCYILPIHEKTPIWLEFNPNPNSTEVQELIRQRYFKLNSLLIEATKKFIDFISSQFFQRKKTLRNPSPRTHQQKLQTKRQTPLRNQQTKSLRSLERWRSRKTELPRRPEETVKPRTRIIIQKRQRQAKTQKRTVKRNLRRMTLRRNDVDSCHPVETTRCWPKHQSAGLLGLILTDYQFHNIQEI